MSSVTPTASTARSASPTTSGPIPSPAITAIWCRVISMLLSLEPLVHDLVEGVPEGLGYVSATGDCV